jgi:hypothetical protein
MNQKTTFLLAVVSVIMITLFTVGVVLAYKNDNLISLHGFKKTSSVNSIDTDTSAYEQSITTNDQITVEPEIFSEPEFVPHKKTPEKVRALYMSAWVAATPNVRKNVVEIIDTTDINSIIIDIKDATGRISFLVDDPIINELGSPRNLIRDVKPFIEELHEKDVYVIGRISVFQDDYMTQKKPEWSIKSKATGQPWKDKKGLAFLDPTNKDVWDYTIRIAKAAHAVGFDEINFDYIRFPSDGNISDISYPLTEGTKSDAMEHFFQELHIQLKILV